MIWSARAAIVTAAKTSAITAPANGASLVVTYQITGGDGGTDFGPIESGTVVVTLRGGAGTTPFTTNLHSMAFFDIRTAGGGGPPDRTFSPGRCGRGDAYRGAAMTLTASRRCTIDVHPPFPPGLSVFFISANSIGEIVGGGFFRAETIESTGYSWGVRGRETSAVWVAEPTAASLIASSLFFGLAAVASGIGLARRLH